MVADERQVELYAVLLFHADDRRGFISSMHLLLKMGCVLRLQRSDRLHDLF